MPSPGLLDEISRAASGHIYQRTAFFVRNQGFVRVTAARRISLEDSLRFEKIHEATYRELEFELIEVPAGPPEVRVEVVRGRSPD